MIKGTRLGYKIKQWRGHKDIITYHSRNRYPFGCFPLECRTELAGTVTNDMVQKSDLEINTIVRFKHRNTTSIRYIIYKCVCCR